MAAREVDAIEIPIPLSPRGPRPAGVIYVRGGDLNGAIKKLKKDFQANVAASLRRHDHYTSPGERARLKSRKARKAARRREARKLDEDQESR